MDEYDNAEIKNLDYGQLLFRQIDRIQALSSNHYTKDDDKLFNFLWSVNLLKSLIPETREDKCYKQELQEWYTKREEVLKIEKGEKKYLSENFKNIQELLEICMNLFARRGMLYKMTQNGTI